MYNNFGEAIGKWRDYATAKFDLQIVAGSTLPINRWAYLEELKQLMQMGVVDDIAVLAETDIRNKEKIAQRKSLYSQLQSQISQLQDSMSDKEGTIETLERQSVQAGIKNKVMQGAVEVNKKTEQVKYNMEKELANRQAISRVAQEKERMETNTAVQKTLHDLARKKEEVSNRLEE